MPGSRTYATLRPCVSPPPTRPKPRPDRRRARRHRRLGIVLPGSDHRAPHPLRPPQLRLPRRPAPPARPVLAMDPQDRRQDHHAAGSPPTSIATTRPLDRQRPAAARAPRPARGPRRRRPRRRPPLGTPARTRPGQPPEPERQPPDRVDNARLTCGQQSSQTPFAQLSAKREDLSRRSSRVRNHAPLRDATVRTKIGFAGLRVAGGWVRGAGGGGGRGGRCMVALSCCRSSPFALGPFEAVFQIGAGAPCRVTPVAAACACVSLLY